MYRNQFGNPVSMWLSFFNNFIFSNINRILPSMFIYSLAQIPFSVIIFGGTLSFNPV
jgi:hypothetical protein